MCEMDNRRTPERILMKSIEVKKLKCCLKMKWKDAVAVDGRVLGV